MIKAVPTEALAPHMSFLEDRFVCKTHKCGTCVTCTHSNSCVLHSSYLRMCKPHVCYISKLHMCMFLQCHMCITGISTDYTCFTCMQDACMHVAIVPHVRCLNMYRLCMFHMHANYMHACCYSATCFIRAYADYVCCAVFLVCFVMIGPRHYTNLVIYF